MRLGGYGWSFLQQFSVQFLNVGITAILARILVPSEFGLLAMISVFSGLGLTLIQMGLGNSLIRKPVVTKIEISSLLVFSLGLATVLTIAFVLSAPLISSFYEREELVKVIYLISPVFLLSAISGIYESLLVKNLRFKEVFFIRFFCLIVSGMLAIYLAKKGYSYYSLVFQMLLQNSLSTIAIVIASRVGVSLRFSWQVIREHINFGSKVTGNALLNYGARNFDNLLIGKFLGEGSLGVYSKAYSLMMMPITNISASIGRVLFPTLSKLGEEKEELSRYYIKSTTGIALLSFPLMVGAFFTADYLVLLLLGDKWLEAIPVFKILCFSGMIQSILTTTGSLFLASNRPGIPLKLSLLTKPVLFLLIYLTAKIGIIEVALAFVGWSLITGVVQMSLALSLIPARVFEFLQPLIVILLLSIVMGGIILAQDTLLTSFNVHYSIKLFTSVLIGIVSYGFMVLSIKNRSIVDIVSSLKEKMKR